MKVRCLTKQNHGLDQAYDNRLLKDAKLAIEKKKKFTRELPICNVDRTVGTLLSHQVAKKYGNKGLPDDTISLSFRGCAGQSFGAFRARGVTMTRTGEANDYLGKGLSGGRIIVKTPENATFTPSENTIAGNVLLYGATSGEAFINGRAGERFAIRNSGAIAIVEGVGDHCCEYMTGGRVVVLGPTGINFGAGMSGGIAYVYDKRHRFDSYCNLDMVDLDPVTIPEDIEELRELIKKHIKYTRSEKAKMILDQWEESLPKFVKVFPMEYRRVLGQMMKEDEEVEREVTND